MIKIRLKKKLYITAFLVAFLLQIAGFARVYSDNIEHPTVVDIVLTGNDVVPDSAILSRLNLELGAEFSPDVLDERVDEINQWGGFGQVTTRISMRREGVSVTVQLDERVRLEYLKLRGNNKISDRKLQRALDVPLGTDIDSETLENIREQITSFYREEGFELATVDVAGRFHEDGAFTLIMDITEGHQLRVKSINFIGNESFSENKLRGAMDTHVYLRIPFIRRGVFDQSVFYDDLRSIERMYYEAGFLDALVGGYWTYTAAFQGYELNVVVYEGPRYEVGDIEVTGNRLFRDEELLRKINLRTGQVYSYGNLESVERNVSRLYSTQGMVDVTAQKGNLDVREVVDPEAGLVDLKISIRETDPVYIRRVKVEGLTKTDEIIVLRHLRFEPGDRVDTESFRASERALRDTGYFDLTRPDTVSIELAPGEGRFRDVIVTVREGPTGQLMLGGGLSSDAGVMANFSITERNFDIRNWPTSWSDFREKSPFRGGGQSLSLNLDASRDRSNFQIAFREPRIQHTDYSFGFRLFSRLTRWDFFDMVKSGGEVNVGRRLGNYVNQQVAFGVEHIHVTGMDRNAPREIARDDGTYLKPYIDLSLSRDTRDSTMFPTSGYVARLNTELSMGDIQMGEIGLNMKKYWPVYTRQNDWRHVFMMRADLGVMTTYGDHDRIPVFERFYAGGRGSIRGFESWGVSPVEREQNEQIGGRSRITGTAEYTVPLFNEHFRWAFFADAGYVEPGARDLFDGWDTIRASYGTGFRWLMPAMGGIPLTLDFALPITKEEYDKTRRLHFHLGIGQTF